MAFFHLKKRKNDSMQNAVNNRRGFPYFWHFTLHLRGVKIQLYKDVNRSVWYSRGFRQDGRSMCGEFLTSQWLLEIYINWKRCCVIYEWFVFICTSNNTLTLTLIHPSIHPSIYHCGCSAPVYCKCKYLLWQWFTLIIWLLPQIMNHD